MKFRLSKEILCLTCLLIFTTASLSVAQDNLQVEVSLDRDSIGLDERATLTVQVSGPSQNLPAPQLTTLPMFEIYSQGRSTNISIVNGRVSATNTYRYLLMPKKPGTFPIDQIAVVEKNKRYLGNSVEITVLNQGTTVTDELEGQATTQGGRTKDYFLEAVVDKKNPYVNEQVTLTLKFFIAVQFYGSPELTEPTTTGFWNEVLGNKAPYYQRINNRRYRVIERKYALFPTHTGDLTIGRSTIRATVADRNKKYRDPYDALGGFLGRGVEVSARSKPIRINVRKLPQKGRPDNFTGTIGRFSMDVIPDKRTVEVNQPVTVTIKISGLGNIKSVAEPPIPELADFRVYRASSNESLSKRNDIISGAKIYEEVFIPKRPGQLEIPALSFNYFDPGLSTYKTFTTKPIKITVTKPEGYTATPDLPYASSDITIGSSANDIRFIKQDLGKTRERGYLLLVSPGYMMVNGLPLVILAGILFIRKHRDKVAGDVRYARSRSAGKIARKRLAKARSLATTDTSGEFYAEISTALTSYIADKLNVSPHGLTIEDIQNLLSEKDADQAVMDLIAQVLKKSDFARFAPSSINQNGIDKSLEDASDVMVKLEGIRFV